MSLATQVASLPHPPSAMNFNGVYLEDKVSGYYTESVEGRYNSSIDITDRDITGVDGSEFVRKRYSARELSVKYSIYADTKIELHEKESEVKRYTREAEAKIIFDDEPQFYWIGTVSQVESEGIDATGSGIFVSNGTITISLNDPFKYSVVTKEFTAKKNSSGVMELTVINNGAVPVPIDYEIDHGSTQDSDNGFVGIVSSEGVIQLGKIQETSDGYTYETGKMTQILSFDTVRNALNDPTRKTPEIPGITVQYSIPLNDPDRSLRTSANAVKGTNYYVGKSSASGCWTIIDSDDTKWVIPINFNMTDEKKDALIKRLQAETRFWQVNSDRLGKDWTQLGLYDQESKITNAYIEGSQDRINWLWPYEVEDQSIDVTTLPYYDGTPRLCISPVISRNVMGTIDYWWHGDVVTIPINSKPEYFYAWFDHWFETGTMGQTGEQSIAFLTEDNRIIGAVDIYKSDYTGNTAVCKIWADNKIVFSYDFEPSNKMFGKNPYADNTGYDDFYKFVGKNTSDGVRAFYFGSYPQFPITSKMKLAKVQIAFSAWQGYPNEVYRPVTINALRELRIYSCETAWNDTPNHYPPETKITINGADTKVYVNGQPKQSEEVVGSKYFLAPPGETKIQFTFSSFCTDTPTCKATIREKYL